MIGQKLDQNKNMKKFLIKLFIVALISITVAAVIELTIFANDNEFWEIFEEDIDFYDHYDRKQIFIIKVEIVVIIVIGVMFLGCIYQSIKMNSYHKGYKDGYRKGYRYHLENKKGKENRFLQQKMWLPEDPFVYLRYK